MFKIETRTRWGTGHAANRTFFQNKWQTHHKRIFDTKMQARQAIEDIRLAYIKDHGKDVKYYINEDSTILLITDRLLPNEEHHIATEYRVVTHTHSLI